MILAAIEGNLIALIVFAAIGAINWFLQKKEAHSADRPQPGAPERGPDRTPSSEPEVTAGQPQEDERLRRFLEALGLPTDQPRPPEPRPQARPPPLPRTAGRATMPRAPRGSQARPSGETVPRPFRRVTPLPPPLPEREHSLDEAEAPTLPVQQISLPLLETRALPEFVTVSSRIAATADLPGSGEAEVDAYREHIMLPAQGRLTELLRSPDDLRRAIVLREVLGTPRGLEGAESLSLWR